MTALTIAPNQFVALVDKDKDCKIVMPVEDDLISIVLQDLDSMDPEDSPHSVITWDGQSWLSQAPNELAVMVDKDLNVKDMSDIQDDTIHAFQRELNRCDPQDAPHKCLVWYGSYWKEWK